MEPLDAFDHGTTYYFHHLAMEMRWLEPVMRFAALWLACPWTMAALALLVVALFAMQKRFGMLLIAGGAIVGAMALVEGVPFLVWLPRPQGAAKHLPAAAELASYPSRGVFYLALLAVLFGLALQYWLSRPWQVLLAHAVAAGLVVWVCVAELWLELTFVTDVLGGLAGGMGLGVLARYFSGSCRDAMCRPG